MVSDELIRVTAKIVDPTSWESAKQRWPGQVAPTIERDGYTRWPLPGYVGQHYEGTRIVFLGTNPGPGKGLSNARSEDVRLFMTLLPEFLRNPGDKTYNEMNAYLATEMPKWDIFSNIGFPQCFQMRISELAYSNVLLVNTPDGVRPGDVAPEVFEFSIRRFLADWLNLLAPKLVVVFGKDAAKHLIKHWQPRPPDLQIVSMGLPTRQVMNTHRQTFEADFENVKRTVDRSSPTARRRAPRAG